MNVIRFIVGWMVSETTAQMEMIELEGADDLCLTGSRPNAPRGKGERVKSVLS